MRRFVILFLCALVVLSSAGCTPAATGCTDAQKACTRVLFIGNSYTYVNDLPSMLAALARSGGHQIETDMAAEGGLTLADHVASSATQAKLGSGHWDFVVLQEQSQIPAIARFRTDQMYPAARQLIRTIRIDGAKPMLYLTWSHRDGWPENGLPDYARMQAALDDGYLTLGRELGVAVAPVGRAWATVVSTDIRPGLWQDDGSHPTTAGTYLAAAVFYAAIFDASPISLSYDAGLPTDQATKLRQVAHDTVLTDLAQWGLP